MVLHPDRHALHGITVILDTPGTVTYIGRFDLENDKGVHLLNVAVHDTVSDGPAEDFVTRSRHYGVRVMRKHLVVPLAEVSAIRPLGEGP